MQLTAVPFYKRTPMCGSYFETGDRKLYVSVIVGTLTVELSFLPPTQPDTPPVTRHSALEDGCGGPAPGQGRDPDRSTVRVLVHGQLGGQHRQQNHPQWISVPGHGLSVSYHLYRRLPPAAVAGMGSPQNRTAEQVLPVVHPAFSFRKILCIGVGSLQHMESTRFIRAHR